jgi:hypothetical protein
MFRAFIEVAEAALVRFIYHTSAVALPFVALNEPEGPEQVELSYGVDCLAGGLEEHEAVREAASQSEAW